jgi:molybdopterin-containing oxidoreductase family membrane subunit
MSVVRKFFSPFQLWLFFLATVLVAGVIAGGMVLSRGLVLTNLSDVVPWGLWITIDLSSIAMSAGAFLLCAAVYLLGLKAYQPVARTATFIGLIGYSMAVLTLMLDIGRPDRFWHALVYWNPHSLLWEVTMCVTLYLTVLLLETIPMVGETEWMQRRHPALSASLMSIHRFAPYLAVAGLVLSSLHQSSLGAAYGVLKARPIWYRPDLSVLFMASAIVGGPSLTVLVSMLAARLTRRAHVDDHLLERVSQFIGWALVVYLYFRFWDALAMTYTYEPGRTEGLRFLTKGPLAFNFWAGEILLGAVLPILLLLLPRFRRVPALRMLALAMVVGGVVAYRWDINMAGQLTLLSYLPQEMTTRYTTYFPSQIEFLSGAGVVAFGVLAITLGIRYLGIVDHRKKAHAHAEEPAALAPAD